MIQHLVAFVPDPIQPEELAAIMEGLHNLQIDGFTGFSHGPNIDAEGKTPAYPYGFICTFSDRAALDRYANNPDHQALGGRLVALCGGDGDAITVFDIQS